MIWALIGLGVYSLGLLQFWLFYPVYWNTISWWTCKSSIWNNDSQNTWSFIIFWPLALPIYLIYRLTQGFHQKLIRPFHEYQESIFAGEDNSNTHLRPR